MTSIEIRTWMREEGPCITASAEGGGAVLRIGQGCYWLSAEDARALGRLLAGEPEPEPEEGPDPKLCAEARRMLRRGPLHRDELMRELGVGMPELRRIMAAVGAHRTSSPMFWAMEA